MHTVNHQVWEKIHRFYQKAALVAVLALGMGIISLLPVSAYQEVKVYYNGTCQLVGAYDGNPDSIMEKAGIPQNLAYDLEYTQSGVVLRVGEVLNHTLTVDGKTLDYTSRTGTVAHVLEGLGVEMGTYDRLTPGADTILTQNTHITLQRVTFKVATLEESVAPPVIYEDTHTMPVGTTRVKVEGVAGYDQVTYKQTIIDGEVAQQEELYRLVLQPARERILFRGTASAEGFSKVITSNTEINDQVISQLAMDQVVQVDENGVPLNYKKCINGLATAYTSGDGGVCSTGVSAGVGYVAVDPNEIPYGTMMYIKTADNSYFYGIAKAADTGGFIHTGPVDVDLYFDTRYECIQFGVRDVEIYIL